MSGFKISELPPLATAELTDIYPTVQNDVTYKVTLSQLIDTVDFPWTEVTGASQAMSPDNGYIANNSALVTLTLPLTAALGTEISVIGKGSGGWKIAQNSSQSIRISGSVTSTGAPGSLASTAQGDSIDLVCTAADTVWTARGGAQGIITIV